MKKVLVAQELHALLQQENSVLNRADFKIFTAASNDELLKVHREEQVNLIITQLDMPGMPTEQFCSVIREEANLRGVSLIMVCANSPAAIEKSSRCRANAVLLRPVQPLLLIVKAQQLLEIASRDTYRVLLSASLEGRSKDERFFCRSRNISATGILIETDRALAEGTQLSLSFFLPDAKQVQASGKIVRTLAQAPGAKDNQYGLMFSEISPEAKRLLMEFVEKKALKARPSAP
jgi:DNA-binding response OmpR family regulator